MSLQTYLVCTGCHVGLTCADTYHTSETSPFWHNPPCDQHKNDHVHPPTFAELLASSCASSEPRRFSLTNHTSIHSNCLVALWAPPSASTPTCKALSTANGRLCLSNAMQMTGWAALYCLPNTTICSHVLQSRGKTKKSANSRVQVRCTDARD